MDNLSMDSHDNDEGFFSRILENQKFRLGAALALGLIVGSGATWATMKTDQPKKSRAVVEQRRVENRSPVQTNNTASTRPSTKKVSLKVALKDCNKIKNKNKRAACIARTKKAYAKRTNSTTKSTTSSVKPATTSTRRVTSSSNTPAKPGTVQMARADNRSVTVAE